MPGAVHHFNDYSMLTMTIILNYFVTVLRSKLHVLKGIEKIEKFNTLQF